MTVRIDDLLDPEYLSGIRELPIEQIRAKRKECQDVGDALSYLRRLVQARLDIVHAELRRRAGGETLDIGALVDDLKDILSEKVRSPGLGRLPASLTPPDLPTDLVAEVDAVAGDSSLGGLPDLSEDQVRSLGERLTDLEATLSAQRRDLHERIDALQEELVRRYKEGEATVDTLLR